MSAMLLGSGLGPAGLAASPADLVTMSQMALLLGRAAGCGLDTRGATRAMVAGSIGPFRPARLAGALLPDFTADVRRHARQQQQGETSDSCADVAQALKALNW